MESLVKLLPEHLANQIAAGEVVQRPASVVKELLENAIDAGASELQLIIKDAGKSLIQVIDNGSGMSAHDARMAFERHATSKISTTDDLFNIRTLGFRGEALASIAAVAQVQVRTRLHDQELGTELDLEGGEFKKSEPCNAPAGTSISVRNLFFNVPARRNFLKSNPVETRHILNEFSRVALANPEIRMKFVHNDATVHDLPPLSLKDRIVQLYGKDLSGKLLEVKEETPYLTVTGFVATPEAARKARGEQFFFVNRRFIRSPFLQHAVTNAYKNMIQPDHFPVFAIFLDIEPKHVDINIHPTKTEVKFDDEKTVYSLLHSVVRQQIGQIIGDVETADDDAFGRMIAKTPPPKTDSFTIGQMNHPQYPKKESAAGWEKLFEGQGGVGLKPGSREASPQMDPGELLGSQPEPDAEIIFQLKSRYIVAQVRGGLMVMDQTLAHERILYEKFLEAPSRPPMSSQQLLFPQKVQLSADDFSSIRDLESQLRHLGFDFRDFGNQTLILHGLPAELRNADAEALFEELIAEVRELGDSSASQKVYEKLALTIARNSAIKPGKGLASEEMRLILNALMECKMPGVSPSGKPTYYMLDEDKLHRHFQR